MEALPVDEPAARMWARLRIRLTESGQRVRINDLWIPAIAASRSLPVITRDHNFDLIDGVANLAITPADAPAAARFLVQFVAMLRA